MKRYSFKFITVLAGLLLGCAIARGERLPVKIYTAADGLGSSFVNSLLRDSHGLIWFATRDGLSRFDGTDFVTYQLSDKDAPPGVEQILEAKNGVYWLTTTGGLYRFDPRANFTQSQSNREGREPLPVQFVSPQSGRLFEDARGNLWLGNKELFLIDQETLALRKIPLSEPGEKWSAAEISSMFETADGSLWMTKSPGLVRRLPGEQIVFYGVDQPNGESVASATADRFGHVWFVCGNSICIFKPEEVFQTGASVVDRKLAPPRTQSLTDVLTMPEKFDEPLKVELPAAGGDSLRRIYRSSGDFIWITGIRALYGFDGRRLRSFGAENGLTAEMVDICEDPSGNLWLGGQNGVTRINYDGMIAYDTADGLGSKAIHTFVVRGDEFYVVSGGGLISRWRGDKFETVRLAIDENASFAWTSNVGFMDSRKEWWILTTEKLYRFPAVADFSELDGRKPSKIYGETSGLPGVLFYRMYEDRSGNLWLSVRDRDFQNPRLLLWDGKKDEFRAFTPADGLANGKLAASFAEDMQGNVWIGFYDGGLVKFSGGRFTEIKNQIPPGFLIDLHFDRRGRLWLASAQSGVTRIDDPHAPSFSSFRYTTENGLSSNNARSLTEAANGEIFVGTARGVDRIYPDDDRIQYFSRSDGLPGDFVVAAATDAKGFLWFGTADGLARFKPENRSPEILPRVRINELSIANEKYPVSPVGSPEIGKLELSANQNNLEIRFSAVDFSVGNTVRYQYMLDGADSGWSPPTKRRNVNYANLAPGAYRFLVRTVTADNRRAGDDVTVVAFRVAAPVWRQSWFVLTLGFGGCVLLFAFYRYRTARLREINQALTEANRAGEALRREKEERLAELERVRLRIARDLHDDVGSSLTQIALFSEVARQREREQKGVSEPLEYLIETSNEMVEAMSDIVWAINPRKDNLQDLVQRMRHFGSELLSAADIDFELISPEAETTVSLGANLRREIFLIFKEAVNNVVKHSDAAEAEAELSLERSTLTLVVKDDGKGFEMPKADEKIFDWKKAKGGNGLQNMRKRAAELGGAFFVESRPGNGTLVRVRIPLEDVSPAKL